ncbi:MAG: pseudouridine synthase [SAR324 cluster bacterium]|nr:pseudouridine synthase [SAR324 cluster bacterium]
MNDRQGTRLQKVIAAAGLASRRGAERLIEEGEVRVNGQVVRRLGTRVVPGTDRVEVRGEPLPARTRVERVVWALYKPRGCVTTLSDPQGRPTVRDFFPESAQRLFPVGRLDYDAEGLILLTNDGQFAQRVAHPSFSVTKTYLVKVRGLLGPGPLQQWAAGPTIDGSRRQPVRARVLHTVNDKTWCEVTLQEGLHHHIKKLFAAIGHPVLKIKRYRIGPVELEDMRPGQSRRLTPAEIGALLGN